MRGLSVGKGNELTGSLQISIASMLMLLMSSATVVAAEKVENLSTKCMSADGTTSELQSGADMLSDFTATTTSGATLATTTIAKGYIRTWYNKYKPDDNCGLTRALSIDLSTTAAADATDFSDYARAELLGRRAGVVNLYFNPFGGRDVANEIYKWNDRAVARDRIYVSGLTRPADYYRRDVLSGRVADKKSVAGNRDPNKDVTIESVKTAELQHAWDRALGFYSFGIGGRGVKTSQEGSDIAAIGTIYAGIGFDGPFHSELGSRDAASPEAAGGFSLEAFVTQNFANRSTIKKMFDVDDPHRSYTTVGASMKFWLSGSFFLGVEYDTAIGSSRSVIKDTTMLRFGYAKAQAPKQKGDANTDQATRAIQKVITDATQQEKNRRDSEDEATKEAVKRAAQPPN